MDKKAFHVRFYGLTKTYPTKHPIKCEHIGEAESPEALIIDGMKKGYFIDYVPRSIESLELVLRYRLYIDNKDGYSHYFDPNQGRYSYATLAEAEARSAGFRASPSAKNHFGDRAKTICVKPTWCWPEHFDAALMAD